jgi:hypothetical protein
VVYLDNSPSWWLQTEEETKRILARAVEPAMALQECQEIYTSFPVVIYQSSYSGFLLKLVGASYLAGETSIG